MSLHLSIVGRYIGTESKSSFESFFGVASSTFWPEAGSCNSISDFK